MCVNSMKSLVELNTKRLVTLCFELPEVAVVHVFQSVVHNDSWKSSLPLLFCHTQSIYGFKYTKFTFLIGKYFAVDLDCDGTLQVV